MEAYDGDGPPPYVGAQSVHLSKLGLGQRLNVPLQIPAQLFLHLRELFPMVQRQTGEEKFGPCQQCSLCQGFVGLGKLLILTTAPG